MSLNPVIEKVIDDKVQLNEMFTAHDVTLEVRNRGHKAGHNEIRDIVHDYYGRGLMGIGYGKTNISVPGGNPILYYPLALDPNNYSNVRGQTSLNNPNNSTINVPQLPCNSGVVTLPSQTINLIRNKAGQKINRCVDWRKTLSIPANLVKEAGFNCGQKVHLTLGNSNDVIEITNHPTAVSCKYYTVDRNQQIRITQSTLNFYGLGGKFYDICLLNVQPPAGNGPTIFVKLHK